MKNVKELAQKVDDAAYNVTPIQQLSLKNKFNEQEAYAIQTESLARRYSRGEKYIGIKMGFTSVAKMKQMGVHDMIWGRLTDTMLLERGAKLNLKRFIHPRAEPEICFWVKKTINRALKMKEVKSYVHGVAAAIEIIDSRYEKFKFSLEDVIADNCSSAGLVMGDWYHPDTPIGDLKMELVINNKVVQEGNSAAILDDPWKSFLAATRLANQYGEPIPAGSYIMAGAATSAVYLKPGQRVEARVERLGNVGFRVNK